MAGGGGLSVVAGAGALPPAAGAGAGDPVTLACSLENPTKFGFLNRSINRRTCSIIVSSSLVSPPCNEDSV